MERGKPHKLATQILVGAWDGWKRTEILTVLTVDRGLSKVAVPSATGTKHGLQKIAYYRWLALLAFIVEEIYEKTI